MSLKSGSHPSRILDWSDKVAEVRFWAKEKFHIGISGLDILCFVKRIGSS